jgi:hypothetical protein
VPEKILKDGHFSAWLRQAYPPGLVLFQNRLLRVGDSVCRLVPAADLLTGRLADYVLGPAGRHHTGRGDPQDLSYRQDFYLAPYVYFGRLP